MAKRMFKGQPSAAVAASGAPSQIVTPFDAIEWGLSEQKLVFRLMHFWEAKNPSKGGMLISLELLLIDEKSTVIQGFVAPNRITRFGGGLRANSIYSLNNFFATPNKSMYRVSDHKYTICFTEQSILTEIAEQNLVINSHRFRFHSFDQFEENCDRKGDLYDIIGQLRLINGENLSQHPRMDIDGNSQKGMVSVHLQPKEGPVLNLYLWDKAAYEFSRKLQTAETTPSVLLVTTVNPKKLGGRVSLTTTSSSRVFLDTEVLPTRDYLTWLNTQDSNIPALDASQVVKVESLTISEIQKFIKTEPPQIANFHCVATIDHLNLQSGWYYIGCSGCDTKVAKGPTTLVCHKCDNPNATGVIKYRLEYSVHDEETDATFVFLDEAGGALIGRKATELIDDFSGGNGDIVQGGEVPPPDCLSEVCSQTNKFEVRITKYNFRASRQTFTVTKIVKEDVVPDCQMEIIQEGGASDPPAPDVERSKRNVTIDGGASETESDKQHEDTTDHSSNGSKRLRIGC